MTYTKYLLFSILVVCPSVLSAQGITRRIHQIDEVTVWGKRPMKEIGVQKTKFDSLALKENIALSMADILTFNSSVFVKSYGRATLSTVAFRGTSPSHTQVTWNGMRINNPMLGMTDFSTIPSYFIDQAPLLMPGPLWSLRFVPSVTAPNSSNRPPAKLPLQEDGNPESQIEA